MSCLAHNRDKMTEAYNASHLLFCVLTFWHIFGNNYSKLLCIPKNIFKFAPKYEHLSQFLDLWY